MLRMLKSIVVPALIGLGLIALIGSLGSALFLYREAAALHPALGWLVLIATVLAFVLLVVVPALRLLSLPKTLARPTETTGPSWQKYLRAYASRLLDNTRLADHSQRDQLAAALQQRDAEALEREVTAALAHLDTSARAIITRHAAAVFSTTAISQSGRLDSAIVLWAQCNMIHEIATLYYQRPTLRELLRLYASVGATAFVAGELQDSELLAVLGAPVTAGITSFIPMAGTDPLVSLLVTSLMDGSANAFLTLRLGVIAQRQCGIRPEPDRRALARSASVAAASLLGGVVSQGASRVATLTRKLVIERAAHGTKRAVQGVAGAGASLFDKVVSLAGKAGSAAARTTGSGLRFLQESLRFWETVAEPSSAPTGSTVSTEEEATPRVS